jgi:hypothetical protein
MLFVVGCQFGPRGPLGQESVKRRIRGALTKRGGSVSVCGPVRMESAYEGADAVDVTTRMEAHVPVADHPRRQ